MQVVAERVGRRNLERVYKIKLPNPKSYEERNRPPSAHEVLRAYCASRGLVGSSGLPDETRSARQMLKDYIDGKLPHYEFPPGFSHEDDDGSGSEDEEEEGGEGDGGASRSVQEMDEMEKFEMGGLKAKKKERKKKEGGEKAHKMQKKTQRKKDRSWRVGNDGGDGMPVVRVIQKPAVNFEAVGVASLGV